MIDAIIFCFIFLEVHCSVNEVQTAVCVSLLDVLNPDDFWPWAEAVQVPEPDLRTNTEPCLDLFMVLQKRTQPTLILEIRLFKACRGTQKHENTHISIWQRLKSHKEILKTKSQRNFWHTRIKLDLVWSGLWGRCASEEMSALKLKAENGLLLILTHLTYTHTHTHRSVCVCVCVC